MICVLIALSLSMTIVRGQKNKFDVGVEGSPSLTFIRYYFPFPEKIFPIIGFSGGFFLQYNFPKTFSLRTNIDFEKKGTIDKVTLSDVSGNSVNTSFHFNFDYLVMPVLFRATFGKKINYFINAGPYVGYLINQTFKYNYLNKTNITNYTNSYNRFDAGITTGLGISIPVKEKILISCEIRNNIGLSNLVKDPTDSYPNKIKTNSTNLLIGFTYKLGARLQKTI